MKEGGCDDDEWADVEWEDNDSREDIPCPPVGSMVGRLEASQPLGSFNLEIDVCAPESYEGPSNKKIKKRKVYVPSAEDKEIAREIHRQRLMDAISKAVATSAAADDDTLQATVLSLVPLYLQSSITRKSMSITEAMNAYNALLEWFVQNFSIIDDNSVTEEEGRDGSAPSVLMQVVHHRAGSAHQLIQVFVSLARSLGISTRYVVSLSVPAPFPSAYPQIKLMRLGSTERGAGEQATNATDAFHQVPTKCERPLQSTLCWAEVLVTEIDLQWQHSQNIYIPYGHYLSTTTSSISSSNRSTNHTIVVDLTAENASAENCPNLAQTRWVSVQIAPTASFDCPKMMHKYRGGDRGVCCVIAVDQYNCVKNVTPRYLLAAAKLLHCRAQRYDHDWLDVYLNNLSNSITANINPNYLAASSQGDSDLSILESVASKKMPSTMSEFKNHEFYALEKQLRVDEAIHPDKRKAVGIFKGIPVYPRDSVETVLSAREWKKNGKKIINGSIPVKLRGFSSDSSIIVSEGSTGISSKHNAKLFGSWQTEQLPQAAVRNGVLPVNEYGNIELLDHNTHMVPLGARYLQEEYAEMAARSLDIPYAKAVVGFENKRGRTGVAAFPVFDGIVLLNEHFDLVQEVAINILDSKLVKNAKIAESKCAIRWQNLVSGLLMRSSIREKYGH